MDSAAGRLKGATAEGRAVPEYGPSVPFRPFPRQTRRAGHADAVLATNDFRERLVGDEWVSAANPSKQQPGSRVIPHRNMRWFDRVASDRHVGGSEGEQMAVTTGLLIFAAVIGSHVFLWWSFRRGGGPRRI